MQAKPLPKRPMFGVENFEKIITEEACLYIDKTGFISEFINKECELLVITRPRRFGKTLILSTLKYFFDIEGKAENLKLFEGLKVTQDQNAMAHFGSRPVMFLTFTNCRSTDLGYCKRSIQDTFSDMVEPYLEKGNLKLSAEEKSILEAVHRREYPFAKLHEVLKLFAQILYNSYGSKPLVLLDEYDLPLQRGFFNNYYNEIQDFIQKLYVTSFNDNAYIYRTLMIGSVWIADTGLNNLKVVTISDDDFKEYFGFTESEVKSLLAAYDLQDFAANTKYSYNGYNFNGLSMYNSWSIIYFLYTKETWKFYDTSTSDNRFTRKLISKLDFEARLDFEKLFRGESIEVLLNSFINYHELEKSATNIWNFLYHTGYLTLESLSDNKGFAKLKIPNIDMRRIFYEAIYNLFYQYHAADQIYHIKGDLASGEIYYFDEQLKKLIEKSFSHFSVDGKHPEYFYHAFLFCLLSTSDHIWDAKLSIDTNSGNLSAIFTPINLNDYGVIIEIKPFQEDLEKDLQETANRGLEQIIKQDYAKELKSKGATKILHIGIGFKGKEFEIVSRL